MKEQIDRCTHTDLTTPGVLQGLLDQNILPILFRCRVGNLVRDPMRVNGTRLVNVYIPPVNENPEERFKVSLKEAQEIMAIIIELRSIT